MKENNHNNNNSSLYKKSFLTTKEAARLLKVGVQTIKNYIYQGKIKSFKTPGGHHRIPRSSLPEQFKDTFMEELKNGTQAFIKSETDKAQIDPHQIYVLIIRAMVKALEIRETNAVGHADCVRDSCLRIAKMLNFSEERKKTLELAALLHDIGKIGVSEQILGKPGRLTEQEYMVVKEHPQLGEKIIDEIDFLDKARPLIRHHHEMYNGHGYPDGLSGEDIPLGARIIFISEVYNSLISDAPYRPAYKPEEARGIIKRGSGIDFDPKLVEVFSEIA